MITSTNVSRETRRRTSADWFNGKQVCRGRLKREDKWLLAPMCAEWHREGLAQTGLNRGMCSTEGTRGGLVTNSTNVSREIRRRTSADWFNGKQVCCGRLKREDKWLLAPMCAERHREGLAQTGLNKGMCSMEGTRGGLVTNSTNVSRETRSRRNGGDRLNQKHVFRRRQETEY